MFLDIGFIFDRVEFNLHIFIVYTINMIVNPLRYKKNYAKTLTNQGKSWTIQSIFLKPAVRQRFQL